MRGISAFLRSPFPPLWSFEILVESLWELCRAPAGVALDVLFLYEVNYSQVGQRVIVP